MAKYFLIFLLIIINSACNESTETKSIQLNEAKTQRQGLKVDPMNSTEQMDTNYTIDKEIEKQKIAKVMPKPSPKPDPGCYFPEPMPDPEPMPLPETRIEQEPEIYEIVEKMPEYKGGTTVLMEFIKTNIRYPEICKEAEIEGNVYIKMIITPEGKAKDFKVLKGVPDGKPLEQEALRVAKLLTEWIPGEHQNKKVPVYYVIPIRFRLD